ncbi:HpcH/HpaI aldolase/citrate lyase family protein [Leifsonia sp. A12D58]|uniref:HpcH/HpaI aldolase/citrate lyase family protein n=1 Tax=Leifsonia sp. A12D58 TaxID=3397674 RepID=UPI0039E04308
MTEQHDRGTPAFDPSAAALVTGLYVPGDRPDRFEKAVATGADLVILDLEDAVAPDQKAAARDAVVRWMTSRNTSETDAVIQVRINADQGAGVDAGRGAVPCADFQADLTALAPLHASFELRVPKVETTADLDAVVRLAPGRPITALIETARGVENAVLIAQHEAVTRLALGESDLASDLGTAAREAIDYARVRILFAARAAGLPAPMLSAFTDIRNLAALRADTERGRALGWVGRTAVHPTQLAVIAEAFRPDSEAVAWASAVVNSIQDGGVSTLTSGEMVDPAMLGRAHSILGLAARLAAQSPTLK